MTDSAKPNFTAWFVMQGLLAALHQPDYRDGEAEPLIEYYKPLARSASKTRLVSRIIHSLPYPLQYCIGDLVTNPGRLRHFCFRKKEIARHANELLSAGDITQVVVLGAGLDLLALRYSKEFPAVRFIEIDTAESQQFKLPTLREHYTPLPQNLEFIEGDLRNPLANILHASKLFDKNAKTLWIAEGFFMFVPEDSVMRIFSEIKKLSAPGSPIIFTTLPGKKITSTASHLLQNLYLKKEKSPFQWVLPVDKIPSFMKNLRYDIMLQIPCDTLHRNYIGPKFKGNHNFAEDIHIAIHQNM